VLVIVLLRKIHCNVNPTPTYDISKYNHSTIIAVWNRWRAETKPV